MLTLFIISCFIFVGAVIGLCRPQKSFLSLLLILEIILIATSINFIGAAYYLSYLEGYLFALLMLVISTGETVIGLTLFVFAAQSKQTLSTTQFQQFKY